MEATTIVILERVRTQKRKPASSKILLIGVERAIRTMVCKYHEYARQNPEYLKKDEFDKLLEREFRCFMTGTQSREARKQFMETRVDRNRDGKITFAEYIEFLHMVASKLSAVKTNNLHA